MHWYTETHSNSSRIQLTITRGLELCAETAQRVRFGELSEVPWNLTCASRLEPLQLLDPRGLNLCPETAQKERFGKCSHSPVPGDSVQSVTDTENDPDAGSQCPYLHTETGEWNELLTQTSTTSRQRFLILDLS